MLPSILLTNIRSVTNKIEELSVVLTSNNISICCITESWLTEKISTSLIDVTGYTCYRKDRNGRAGGGVMCYVRCDIACQRLIELEADDVESNWLLYRQKRMPRHLSHISIAIIYHPPAADSYATVTHIAERLDLLSRRHPSCGIILTGDFNRLPDTQIRQFPLQQVVRAPTRGTATLDKIYTNVHNWYCEPHILPNIGKSDHMVVCLMPKSADQQPHGKRV